MKIEAPQIATIDALSHDGRGIAHINNKTTFIHGALPSEKVMFTYTRRKSKYDEGKITEIIEPVPSRVTPACPHFGVCGGCQLQHLAHERQLLHKQQVMLEHLQHFGQVTPEKILPPLSAGPYGYRRKARLGARYIRKIDEMAIGFREQNGRYITKSSTCTILDPRVGNQIEALKILLSSLHAREHIPQIEVACGDAHAALIFRHVEALDDHDINCLRTFARTHQLHLYLQPNKPAPLSKLWPDDDTLLLSYAIPEHSINIFFHPQDFTQVNAAINHLLINEALLLLALEPTDRVLDLFCGLGNFSLPMAKYAASVLGIEGDDAMVARANHNARKNDINNCHFLSCNLFTDFEKQAWWQASYDKLLLDPPRTGALELVSRIKELPCERIVYVSCNTATLARDAGVLVNDGGYTLTAVGIADMFPHTSHVETIALFTRNH